MSLKTSISTNLKHTYTQKKQHNDSVEILLLYVEALCKTSVWNNWPSSMRRKMAPLLFIPLKYSEEPMLETYKKKKKKTSNASFNNVQNGEDGVRI